MKQFVVIGLGRFGKSIAQALSEKNFEVLAIDENEDRIKEMEGIVSQAVVMDATDDKGLKELGVADDTYKKVKKLSSQIEDKRKEVKKPVLELSKQIDSAAKEAITPLEQARKELGNKIGAYTQERQAAADEAFQQNGSCACLCICAEDPRTCLWMQPYVDSLFSGPTLLWGIGDF